MKAQGIVRLLVVGLLPALAAVAWAAAAQAVPPWGRLLDTHRVEADPKKPYTLTEDHGPWMIMTCGFSGANAQQQAHDLAIELRQRYKLEAYVHKAAFKLDDPNGGRGANPFGGTRWQYKKFKNQPEIDEVAVLVGNYRTIDDPEAQKTLQKLKYAAPDCLKTDSNKPTSRTLAAMRAIQDAIPLPDRVEHKKRGPLGHAFVTTNPLLPAEYFAPRNGIDELVLRMNKDVTHSLLDCPGRYTVQVARFMGQTIIDQREIMAIEAGKEVKSTLAEAAEKAHRLTEALRDKGFEAYEFHDRYASIVTVGSFDSVGTPRSDGKIEINPQIHRIMQTFGAKAQELPGNRKGPLMKQTLVGIGFDIQPIPVEVPKRSISRELAAGL